MVKKRENYPITSFLRDIWNFLEGSKLKFGIFVFIRLFTELGPFLLIFLLGAIVDFFTTYQTGQSLQPFFILILLIGITGISQVWIRTFAKIHLDIIGAKTRKKVREKSMQQLLHLELRWHEQENTGSKLQKINHGSAYIQRLFSYFLSHMAPQVIIGITASTFIFLFLGWKYAIFAFAYATIFLSIEYYYIRKITSYEDELNKISEKVSGKLHESASNVLSVKSLGLKKIFEKSTAKQESEYYNIWLKRKKIGLMKSRLTKTFAATGYAIFLLIVGIDFVSATITLGSIVVFGGYFERLRSALGNVSETVLVFIAIKSGIGRLMTILNVEPPNQESPKLLEIPKNWKQIQFSNVSFKYKDKLILKNFNLKINRNEKIAIVGRSGCGKSTITKLLLRLYKPNSGIIAIDNVPIEKFEHSSITDQITAVLQDSEMFDFTLAKNIAISSKSTNHVKLKKSIYLSHLNKFISKLPKGLNTLLGEKGYKVSGGERQRIGIARAIYKNSPMILLDEATSHLDSKTEQKIQENLETKLPDKTLLIIAHRLSTIKNVDKVVYMENGKVVEQGKFKDLITQDTKFNSLYKIQQSKSPAISK